MNIPAPLHLKLDLLFYTRNQLLSIATQYAHANYMSYDSKNITLVSDKIIQMVV